MNDWNANHCSGKPGQWLARWIAFPYRKGENAFFLARNEFSLAQRPSNATVYVSARLKYRLWINGMYAGEGPARSGLEDYAYDSFSIGDLLAEGANVVAAEVNDYIDEPCSLLLQIDAEIGGHVRSVAKTGTGWRCRDAAEFSRNTPLFAFADYSESYDFRRIPRGWKVPGFDDSSWSQAVLLDPFSQGRVGLTGATALPIAKVSPRPVPGIQHRRILPVTVLEAGEAPVLRETGSNPGAWMMMEPHLPLEHCSIRDAESLLHAPRAATDGEVTDDDRCVVSRPSAAANAAEFIGLYDPYLVLDFGRLMNAYAEIEFEWDGPDSDERQSGRDASAANPGVGATVDIGYSDRILQGRLQTQPYADMCSADRVELGAEGGHWRSFHWRQFRYLQISIRDLRGRLRLKRVSAVRCDYPFGESGSFLSADRELDRLWEMSRNTIKLCTYDNFMDNGLREKQPWTGDIATIISGTLAMFGDDPVIRRYFSTNIGGQRPSGIIPAHWPETSVRAHSISPEGNVLWFEHPMALLLRLAEYVKYSGRQDFAASLRPQLDRYLDLLGEYTDADGVLCEIPGVHWIDWAPVTMRGAAFVTNVWYAEILRFAGSLRGADNGTALARQADGIRAGIRRRCWDANRGLYRDSEDAPAAFSEHTNYTALLYGLVDQGQTDALLEGLRAPDVVRVEPSFMQTPLLSLIRAGRRGDALRMIRDRYKIWLDAGYDTLPEEWHPNATFRSGSWRPRTRALAQAASCGLPAILAEGVLGLTPAVDGFEAVRVEPAFDLIEFCEGRVPTPRGFVSVRWRNSEPERSSGRAAGTRTIEVTIELPARVSGVLVVSSRFAFAVGGHPAGQGGATTSELKPGLNQFNLNEVSGSR